MSTSSAILNLVLSSLSYPTDGHDSDSDYIFTAGERMAAVISEKQSTADTSRYGQG